MVYRVYGILQAKILEWVAFPFSRGSSQPWDWTQVSHCRQILYHLSHKGSPRILGWVAYPFSSGSSWPRNWTEVSCIAGGFFTNWAVREGDKGSQQLWDTSHDPVLDVQEGQWILHRLSTRGKMAHVSYWDLNQKKCLLPWFTSVQFSHSVMSDSLQPHGLQHSRLPRPSCSPRVCSDSYPLSPPWCHLKRLMSPKFPKNVSIQIQLLPNILS